MHQLTKKNICSIIFVATVSCWVLGGIAMEEKKKKEELIKMIESIENADTIKYLHTFIKTFLEEWG